MIILQMFEFIYRQLSLSSTERNFQTRSKLFKKFTKPQSLSMRVVVRESLKFPNSLRKLKSPAPTEATLILVQPLKVLIHTESNFNTISIFRSLFKPWTSFEHPKPLISDFLLNLLVQDQTIRTFQDFRTPQDFENH